MMGVWGVVRARISVPRLSLLSSSSQEPNMKISTKVKGVGMSKVKGFYPVIVAALVLSMLAGCSRESDDKQTKKSSQSQTKTQQAPKIEIIQGDGKEAIKVEAKKHQASSSKNSDSFYYDYDKKEQNEKSTQKPRSAIDAYTHIRSPYERVRVSLLQRQLSTTFRLKCSPCHDDYANGVIGPSLLGKSEQYIYEKIIAFKNGTKSNPLMSDLVKKMDDAQIRSIAKEIYTFNEEVQRMRDSLKKDAK